MTALLRLLRAITSALLAAGLAAASAGVVAVMPTAETAGLGRFGFELGGVWIASAGLALLLMPGSAALVGGRGGGARLPASHRTLVVALAAVAALQAPALLAWLADNRARLAPLFTGRPDPTGLDSLPAIVLGLVPAIGLLTLVTFVLTSLLAIVVPPAHARRVLASCVAVQAGLILGSLLIERGLRTLASRAVPQIDGPEATSAAEWVASYHRSAAQAALWSFVTFCGYVLAAAWARTTQTRSAVEPEPQVRPHPVPAADARHPPPPQTAPSSAAFEASSYAVKPRMSLFEALITRRISSYDINTIPPTTRARYSFAWATGVLRRDPDGPPIVSVSPARPPGLFRGGTYVVRDERGATLATLTSVGADWNLADPATGTVVHVTRSAARRGLVTYQARIGDAEVAAYRWALHGTSVMSAELDVEFGPSPGVHRGVALILGVILEQAARLASERR